MTAVRVSFVSYSLPDVCLTRSHCSKVVEERRGEVQAVSVGEGEDAQEQQRLPVVTTSWLRAMVIKASEWYLTDCMHLHADFELNAAQILMLTTERQLDGCCGGA